MQMPSVFNYPGKYFIRQLFNFLLQHKNLHYFRLYFKLFFHHFIKAGSSSNAFSCFKNYLFQNTVI